MSALASIVGVGAMTPIGSGAWVTAAAARAGLCGFREHPCMIDTVGEPMRVARAPWLDVGVGHTARCIRLLLPALEEALRGGSPGWRVGAAIGLPPLRPGRDEALAQVVTQAVRERFDGRLATVRAFETGHAAALLALDAALHGLCGGSIDACLVAGVDSYLDADTLEWIEECDQLHGAGPLNNAWGFIPGEAAAALLVCRHSTASPRLADIVGLGLGTESRLIKTDAVCIGEGLTQAIRKALATLPAGAVVDNVFCDMNGEAYRADEYGFACLRTKERFREATDFVAPADCWGDVGAAGAPLHVLLAIASCRKGYAKGDHSMVWASSESGERGAAVLRAPLAERE